MGMIEDIQQAIAQVRAADEAMPVLVAGPAAAALVRGKYPWYPEDKLRVSQLVPEDVVFSIDPQLFESPAFHLAP